MAWPDWRDICLNYGHKKEDRGHDTRCQKPYCDCLGFRTTFLMQ